MAPGTAKTDASAPQAAIADQKLSAGNEEGLLKVRINFLALNFSFTAFSLLL
jgi:hypothetical protein